MSLLLFNLRQERPDLTHRFEGGGGQSENENDVEICFYDGLWWRRDVKDGRERDRWHDDNWI
jgi:hypothetical protein